MPEPLPYEKRKVVGRFKVLAGRHSEDRTYLPGDVVASRYDLRLMNSPGAKKFELQGDVDEAAIEFNLQGAARPAYLPENPQTLPPKQFREYQQTGRVPVHTGEGDEEALAAGSEDVAGVHARDDVLDQMTADDLRELAEEEGVNLSGVSRGDQKGAAQAIRRHRAKATEDSSSPAHAAPAPPEPPRPRGRPRTVRPPAPVPATPTVTGAEQSAEVKDASGQQGEKKPDEGD
jgi:hypothetical protein